MPDLSWLVNAGPIAGWLAFAGFVLVVFAAILAGKLVPGPTHDRALRREDKQDERLDTFATGFKDLSKGQEFLVGFVKRREDRDPDA